MADLLTTDQKNKQRGDGHRSKFYLSIARPSTLLTCLVAGTLSRGEIAITVDNGTGDASLLRAGMTVKIVNSYGQFETGLVSASLSGSSPAISGTLNVDPNNILWDDNAVITVEDMHDPRSIPPEFDASTGISKKRSTVFSGQTAKPGPLLRMGGHKAGFLESGQITFDLDAAGLPVAPGASIVSYLWSCPAGGTIADPNAASTTITYNSAGGRWVYCTATDSNGKTQTGARHHWAHDPDPESSDYPYVDFADPQIPLTFGGGGSISLNATGVTDFTAFRDGALVMIWREAWFGSTAGPISLITGQENVNFLGYVVKDTITTDAEYGTVSFDAQYPANVMRSLYMQALSIHAEQTIQYWFQTTQYMTLIVALQWLLYWHSNLLTVLEWHIPTGGLYKKLFKFNEGTLFAQVQDLVSKYAGQLGCDKAGNMYVEPHANLLDQAGRDALDTLMDITNADWRERLVIVRQHKRRVPAVSGKGFYYDGANVLQPYCSVAPTKVPEATGAGPQNLDGMVVADQDHLNRLTGQQLALGNREIEEVRVSFAGDYSVLDVFPQRWCRMTLAAGDTPRGISFTDMRFVPRSVTQVLNTEAGHLDVDVVFEPEVNGPPGVFDPCPTEGTAPSSPLANRVGEPATPTPSASASALAAFSSLRYLPPGATSWTDYDTDFVANDGSLDPFWRIKQKSNSLARAIYWAVGGGGTVRRIVGESEKTDRNIVTDPPNDWSDATAPTAATTNLVRICSSIFASGRHYVAATFYTGSLWRSWVGRTDDDFVTVTWYTLFEMGDTQTKILSIAEDIQNGSRLLLTCWRNGTLYVESWETSGMTQEAAVSLGSAAEAELDLRRYFAAVTGAPGDKDLVYVFGRMLDPVLLTGTYQIIVSDDALSTFSSFVNDWGADHCADLAVSLEDGSMQRTFYALRSKERV